MRRLRRYIPILALLLAGCMTSCRHSGISDGLQRAEALMETNPHAARAVLDSLNLQSSFFIFQSKDAALYALLKTQADYKCFLPLASDSLARIATDYYGTPRRPDYHAAMAWYTLGCVYTDMHQTEDAFAAYLKALSGR